METPEADRVDSTQGYPGSTFPVDQESEAEMVVKKVWFFLLVSALLFGGLFNPSAARAQDEGMIIAEGFFINQEFCWVDENTPLCDYEQPFEVMFFPGGGKVTGYAYWERLDGLVFSTEVTCSGTFSGGDGGAILGECNTNLWVDSEPYEHDEPPYSWQGNLYANGTGSGTLTDPSGTYQEKTWQVTFSPQAFAAGVGPTITEEPKPVDEDIPPEDLDQVVTDIDDTDLDIYLPPIDQPPPTNGGGLWDVLVGGMAITGTIIAGILGIGLVAGAAAIGVKVLGGSGAASAAAGGIAPGISGQAASPHAPPGQILPDNFIQSSEFGGPADNPHSSYQPQEDGCRPY